MSDAVPKVGPLSIGYRALAHLIAGVEFLAVLGFAFVLLDTPVPGLATFPPSLWVTAFLVGTAYLLGLVVDGTATKLWSVLTHDRPTQFNRKGDRDVPRKKDWVRERTDLDEYPQLDRLDVWLKAQRWFWESAKANAEAGDLRLRLMLGKDSALNAALVWLFAMALNGLVVVIGLLTNDVTAPVWGLCAVVLVTGSCLFWAFWGTMVRPGVQRPFLQLKRWWLASVLLLVVLGWSLGLAGSGVAVPEGLKLGWLTLIGILGPGVIFAFIYVRLDANAVYHRLVRDAAVMGSPGGTESGTE